jgi:hypothetical protein
MSLVARGSSFRHSVGSINLRLIRCEADIRAISLFSGDTSLVIVSSTGIDVSISNSRAETVRPLRPHRTCEVLALQQEDHVFNCSDLISLPLVNLPSGRSFALQTSTVQQERTADSILELNLFNDELHQMIKLWRNLPKGATS